MSDAGQAGNAADSAIDRRRSPRVLLPDDEECSLQVRARVRLVDISATGALVESDLPLPLASMASTGSPIWKA